MDVVPVTMTITQLLSSRCQFTIPRFQREYSWEKKNYSEFLEDMIKCLKIHDGKIVDTSYFLGTMLFVGNLDKAGQVLDVIDGQQRLTTITILFSAISDRFRSNHNEKLSEKIFEYIMTEDDDGNPVRIIQSKTHYPFFSFFIQDRLKEENQKPSSEEEESIKESFTYFYEKLDEQVLRNTLAQTNDTDVSGISYEDILKALRDQVLKSSVIVISTKERKDANTIYEILNAKGKRLADIDLIKNHLFAICDDTEPADYADYMWNETKKLLYSRNETIGMGTFFRHYWISKYSKSSENKLYDNFKKHIKEDKDACKEFLHDMNVNAKRYIQIVSPSREDYGNKKQFFWIVQTLNCLSNMFGIVQTRIALMAVLEKREAGLLSEKLFKKLLIYLEEFHFVYNAMFARRANVLDSIYGSFARDLRKCTTKESCTECIKGLIDKMDRYMPTKEEFVNCFTKLAYTKKESPDNLKVKYIINKLECYYSSNNHEVFMDDGSIEHILCEKEGGIATNIGNLILLEIRLNNDAGEEEYSKKKAIYAKSSYTWVEMFLKDNETWSEDKIVSRAQNMADVFWHGVLKRDREN